MPVRSKRILIALAVSAALFVSGCASPSGGVTTATVISLATPAVAVVPTYDARASRTVTVTPVGFIAPSGGLPVPTLLPPSSPCPTVVGATRAVSLVTAPATTATPAMTGGTVLPALTATPLPVPTCSRSVRGAPAGSEAAPIPPTAAGSTCTFPALASVPPPPATPLSPTGSPPPTVTAIAAITPGPSPAIGVSRPGTATRTAGPATPAPQIAVRGTVAPTIAPTATVGPSPALPTATRVGVPARRQFLSTTIDGTPGVLALTPVAMPTSPDLPAFSQGEVCTYVRTHPPHGNKLTTYAAPDYRVTAITLTTLGQFDLMFGTSGIAPADTLVYVVELAGEFTISGGPAPGVVNSYASYMEVFDAHTGRILIEGGFAR